MKAVILAGGLGTRLSEETNLKPKPMVEIGGKPILWHIMKIYSAHGINEFVICCGFKGYMIKEYFNNYFMHTSDVTIDIANNSIDVHNNNSEPWRVTLIDTGETSMTGGRLKRIEKFVQDEDAFCFTYGDGLSNINIKELIAFHKEHGKLATVTAVKPPGRYGALLLEGNEVEGFIEKPPGEGGYINGGFFVLSPKVFNLIDGDQTTWENEPLQILSSSRELQAFKHNDFWQPMDTLREKNLLEEMWSSGKAPWKVWN